MERKKSLFNLLQWSIISFLLLFILPFNVHADENKVDVQLTGKSSEVKIYSEDEKEEIVIDSEKNLISVVPGTYKYKDSAGASGEFEVTQETTELKLVTVNFKNVSPTTFADTNNVYLPELGTLTVYDKDGKHEFQHETEDVYTYLMPQQNGDIYYRYIFTPFDDDYQTIEGHFYVYGDTRFGSLNLSDSGRIKYIKKSYRTVKAPKDMEILTYWEVKFYTAKNWTTYEPFQSDENYNYYKIPDGMNVVMRQEGKVTRLGWKGEWNEDKTIYTVSELEDNPNQIVSAENTYYASMLNNLPESSEVDLKVGEYFDITPLRAWQAISNGASNEHSDPEWHYAVVGGSDAVASVEITEDDKTGQFGRIHANGAGKALVVFWYDAMEAPNDLDSNGSDLYLWSALWPELTGVAVINVTEDGASNPETQITTNIDATEGKTVYYLRDQTSEEGVTVRMNDTAEYTFTPEATTGENTTTISSVRVHTPIMVEDGQIQKNPQNWLTDKSWKTYKANTDGSYTISLAEGRNIVEIKAGDAVAYHVILARGMDVQINNMYNPGQKLAVGDTAQISLSRLIPPVFKMGAIYNPSGVVYHYNANGVESELGLGQYMSSKSTRFNIRLTEEDEGTFEISDGYLSTAGWGANWNAHKKLNRNSMAGYWSGGDNPNIDYGKLSYLPGFNFQVENNDELEEVTKRDAGLLRGLKVGGTTRPTEPSVLDAKFYTSKTVVPRNQMTLIDSTAIKSTKGTINVGAEPMFNKETSRLLVKYWYGDDSSKFEVKELDWGEISWTKPNNTGQQQITSFSLVPASSVKEPGLLNIEVIVIPSDGYPMTYSVMTYAQTNLKKYEIAIPLGDLQISSSSEKGTFGRFDGILETEDFTYTDENNTEITQSLGYGFIGTEKHFQSSVPYETDKIKLSATAINSIYTNDISITVNDDETVYSNDDDIPLKVGDNILKVSYAAKRANGVGKVWPEYNYTIDITRRSAAKKVSFEIPEGASVRVMQNNKIMQANEEGTYTLENGDYEYYVSKSGYVTKKDSFSVTDEKPELKISVGELEALPEQSGTVSVRIAGQKTVLCPTLDVEIPKEVPDLTAKRYVQYNHGGYTALHALLTACDSKEVGYYCYRGKLTVDDEQDADSKGVNAGWICEINGIVCKDPANTLVNNGDKVEFYYNSDLEGMTYAWLTPEQKEVERGTEVTLTLSGKEMSTKNVDYSAIAGAKIYEGSKCLGTTNESGQFVVNTNSMTLGTHYLTATLEDEKGQNILTAVMSTLTIKKAQDSSAEPGKTVVSFRLIGDTQHGTDTKDHKYTTWLATDTYTFEADEVTVGDVFKEALDRAGLSYEGIENNYISAITAPQECGGFELKEKDNGKNSGWMYTVNGVHPDKGLNEWYVTTGDEIVWHYIDDYKVEQSDMKDESGFASSGNASTWNKWLEALDETPGARERGEKVENQIKQIDETIELTDECEAKITTARKAYDSLTREEKRYVSNYDVLLKAEEQLAALKKEKADKEAADAVIAQIDALPTAENVTLEHQEAVDAARDAYSKLTDDQKKLVSKETTDKLESAEKKIAQLLEEQAADLVLEEMNALPSKDNLTLDDEVALAGAEAHYNALSDAQKEYLNGKAPESVAKLGELRTQLEKLKKDAADKAAADAVTEKLNALPSEEDVMFQDEAVLKQAREAYDALSDDQKKFVSGEAYDKLEKAEKKLEALKAEAEAVTKQIQELPAVGDLKLEDAEKVSLARSAYDALNADQKRQLTESGVVDTLLTAENQISLLEREKEEAEKVAQQINSLPEVKDLKLADKTAVEAARKAYDALSDNQKAMIEDAKKALEEREAEIKRLQELADNTDKPDPDNKDDNKKDDNKDNNKDNNTSTTDKNNNKGSGTTTGTTNKGSKTTTGTTTNKGTQSGSTTKTTGTTTGSQAQTNGKQGTDSSVKSAKTGDETDFLLPMAGLIGASGAFAGVILYYKKRRKDTGVEKKEEK